MAKNAISVFMLRHMTLGTFLALTLLFVLNLPAMAQLQIQIGGNEADFKARLAAEGYDRIDTVKLGFSESKFDACKGGKRYRVQFEWTGRVERKVIGDCRQIVDEDTIRKILRDRGIRRITIEDRAGNYLALGCQGNVRYRFEMNYYGDITRERRIGACEEVLSPEDVISKLEEDGYNRITFTNRQLPQYRAEACLKNDRLELIIDRFGEIRQSRQIGRCRGAMEENQIVSIMEEKGYRDVTVISARPPRYLAQGCRDRNLMEVTLNRWGEVSDEVRIGRCRNEITEDEIYAAMQENGYKNISIQISDRRFVTRGCKDNRYEEIILAQSGRLIDRKTLGNCNAPKINDLAETLRGRGLSRLQFFVDACENANRIRIRFDEFANRVGSEIIGKC